MRDIFEDIFTGEPPDPMAAARRGMRPPLRKRFYRRAEAAERGGSFEILLDGKPLRTPARRALAAPSRALADAIAAEWNAQGETIEPAGMPLTRLANSIIDGVADKAGAVADDIVQYLACDLLLYRAKRPEELVALQVQIWDPVIAWAQKALGARLILAQGVVFSEQPAELFAAARTALPADATNAKDLWRLGALHAATTLTGSALLTLALAHGALDLDAAWRAAHLDEDWNMDFWGCDALALARREFRFGEMQAAAGVLQLLA